VDKKSEKGKLPVFGGLRIIGVNILVWLRENILFHREQNLQELFERAEGRLSGFFWPSKISTLVLVFEPL